MTPEFDRRDVPFADRVEAGDELAVSLRRYAGRSDVVVLGLPRGGVPVAARVAAALGAPLDVFAVRKLGVPGQRELAMGAIASGGARVLNHALISQLRISDHDVATVMSEEGQELARQERVFRSGRPPVEIAGRVAILVDDGLATGATMQAAVRAVRDLDPSRVVVAAPVASAQACHDLEAIADEVICARIPRSFLAVGRWYVDFEAVADAEVKRLLHDASTAAMPPDVVT